MHWILGGSSFSRNHCIDALWHGGDQPSGVMEVRVALTAAFRLSALMVLASFIYLLAILHRFSMGLRKGQAAGQLSTTQWSLKQLWYLLLYGQVTNPAGIRNQHPHISRGKHEVLYNFTHDVNNCPLGICQVSSLPHDYVASWPRIWPFRCSGNLCRLLSCFAD